MVQFTMEPCDVESRINQELYLHMAKRAYYYHLKIVI